MEKKTRHRDRSEESELSATRIQTIFNVKWVTYLQSVRKSTQTDYITKQDIRVFLSIYSSYCGGHNFSFLD